MFAFQSLYSVTTDLYNILRNKMAGTNQLSVFIAFCHQDAELFHHLRSCLEKKGITVRDYEQSFAAGEVLVDNSAHWIMECDRFMQLLTDKSRNSPWCTWESILALEKAQNTNRRSAMFLLHDVDKEKLPKIDLFEDMPIIDLELESDGVTWKESNLDYVVKTLKEEVTIQSVLPHGNIATGQVWSHFFGLHDVLLPALEEKVKKNEFFETGHMPIKYYEMIPKSGQVQDRLDKYDGISSVGKLEPIKEMRAGNMRYLSPDVYKIKDGESEYYCVAGYPSTLSVISKLVEKGHITQAEAALYIARYVYTMSSILNHPTIMETCHNNAQLLTYNDTEESPAEVLLNAIKQDLQFKSAEDSDSADQIRAIQQEPLPDETKPYDVVILNAADTDTELVIEIQDYLQNKDVKVCKNQGENYGMHKRLEMAVQECCWIIFLLSKASMKEKDLDIETIALLSDMISKWNISIIPVLVDVDENQMPETMRWVTYVDLKKNSKQQCLEKLQLSVKGKTVPMFLDSNVPAGNVALGLAYGYVFNLLDFIIPGVIENIPDTFEEKGVTNYKCPKKFYLLVPRSLKASGSLADHSGVKVFGDLKHICKDHSGATSRKYTFRIHSLTGSSEQDYYFVGLYPAPILTLWQMENLKIGGLKEGALQQEAKNFCAYVQDILIKQQGSAAKVVKFIEFNDATPGGLKEELLPQIKKDLFDETRMDQS